jgi:Invasin, domain 3
MSRGRLLAGSVALLTTIAVASSGGLVTSARADTDHVTNCTDTDPGSLRAVVNAAANGDTVVFDVNCTGASPITLSTEILVTGKAVTIDGTGNFVTISGADTSRIFNAGGGGTLILKHLTVTHGAAGDGGALVATGSLTVEDVTVSSSTSTLTGGGAIATFSGGTLAVSGSTFIGNTAPRLGGAIFNNSSNATIETSTFIQNQSSDAGGGIGTAAGVVLVSRSTFVGNTAVRAGGAVFAEGPAQVTLANSTLTGNTSTQTGAAIFMDGGTAALTNDTLTSNNISLGGAGAEISTRPSGGGTVTVANTIVSGNSGSNCAGTITDDGNNLQFGDTTCGFALTANPRLGPLSDNTGPTQTIALGQGSAAIGGADPAICRLAAVGNTDQRGQFRTNAVRNACDIGAYDTGGAIPGAPSGTTTTVSCADCQVPVGGLQTSITVQAKSATGQSLTVGGDTVELTTTRGTLSAVRDNGDGTYTASLTSGNKKATATVSGTIDGQQIDSTATVSFTAERPSAARTTISARRSSVASVRGRSRIVVDSQDRFGNDIPKGGAKVRLKTTAGKIRALRDLKNGNYMATLSRNRAKNQVVVVTGTLNGKRIKDNAVVLFK